MFRFGRWATAVGDGLGWAWWVAKVDRCGGEWTGSGRGVGVEVELEVKAKVKVKVMIDARPQSSQSVQSVCK